MNNTIIVAGSVLILFITYVSRETYVIGESDAFG